MSPRSHQLTKGTTTTFYTAPDRIVAGLARIAKSIYAHHADRCTTCCLLGGEFCRTGHTFYRFAETLETEQLW